jgi:hypothetical protein
VAAQAARASPWIGGERAIASHAIGALDGSPFQEAGLHAELGWPRERVAIVLDGYVRTSADHEQTAASVLVKHSVLSRGRWALSTSAGPAFASGDLCAGGGGEARGPLGRSIGRGARPNAFAAIELTAREVIGCRALKGELTLGYQPGERWLLLAKSFSDQPRHGTDTLKVQISAVRLGARRGVEFGLRARVDGADPEPAFVVSIWRGRG